MFDSDRTRLSEARTRNDCCDASSITDVGSHDGEEATLRDAASRCEGCETPTCRQRGCPLKNPIPELNALVSAGQWREACRVLHAASNFPEITSRLCAAPCRTACGSQGHAPVPMPQIESFLVERAFAEGWVSSRPPRHKTGKQVAIVGSGPAALAVAQQLVRAGHDVIVFEESDAVGGVLRQAAADGTIDKEALARRVEQLVHEGVRFATGLRVGRDIAPACLPRFYDAVCLTASGSESVGPQCSDHALPCPALAEQLGIAWKPGGGLSADNYMTSAEGVFSTGAASANATMVAQAIHAGRQAADAIDRWLTAR